MGILHNIKKKLKGCLDDADLLEFSLDGLEGKDRHHAEKHLGECQRCREQLREYMSFAEAMALSVPQVAPPKGLKAGVLKRVGKPVKA